MKQFTFLIKATAEISNIKVVAKTEEEAMDKVLSKDLITLINEGFIEISDVDFLESSCED